MTLLRLLLAGEALVLFLDKKNQKSSHLRYASLPHMAIALQSRAAPWAVTA
jgi:hypothetical protein